MEEYPLRPDFSFESDDDDEDDPILKKRFNLRHLLRRLMGEPVEKPEEEDKPASFLERFVEAVKQELIDKEEPPDENSANSTEHPEEMSIDDYLDDQIDLARQTETEAESDSKEKVEAETDINFLNRLKELLVSKKDVGVEDLFGDQSDAEAHRTASEIKFQETQNGDIAQGDSRETRLPINNRPTHTQSHHTKAQPIIKPAPNRLPEAVNLAPPGVLSEKTTYPVSEKIVEPEKKPAIKPSDNKKIDLLPKSVLSINRRPRGENATFHQTKRTFELSEQPSWPAVNPTPEQIITSLNYNQLLKEAERVFIGKKNLRQISFEKKLSPDAIRRLLIERYKKNRNLEKALRREFIRKRISPEFDSWLNNRKQKNHDQEINPRESAALKQAVNSYRPDVRPKQVIRSEQPGLKPIIFNPFLVLYAIVAAIILFIVLIFLLRKI